MTRIRQACKANVVIDRQERAAKNAAKAAKAARSARVKANRVTANTAGAVAAGAPKRDWTVPCESTTSSARSPSPPAQKRCFAKTIASPGRLPTECSEVVFQGVRSPHIFMVQSDEEDNNEDHTTEVLGGKDRIPIPTRLEFQARGSHHVHNII